DWGRYGGQFAALARTYGIPVALHTGEPLSDNPAVIALLDLLALPALDFRRRELLDTLNSPYFQIDGLGAESTALLARVSQAMLVIGGREEWLSAIAAAKDIPVDPDEPDAEMLLTPEQSELLYDRVLAFFDAITPPRTAP